MSGTNAIYVEEMYRRWKADRASVHASWDAFFANADAGAPPGAAFTPPPSLQPGNKPVSAGAGASGGAGVAAADGAVVRLLHLVRSYQVRGHLVAKLDPLDGGGPEGQRGDEGVLAELDPATYGFTEADMEREFDISGFGGVTGFLGVHRKGTLRQMLEALKEVYCGPVGYEYMHMQDRTRCNWIRERIEQTPHPPKMHKDRQMHLLERLSYGETLERFLATKYNTAKRFGLEGAESLIPGLKFMIDRSTELGVNSMVLGMPHRGRLNTLVNVVRKPAEMLFAEFQGTHVDLEEQIRRNQDQAEWVGTGDVKYHLGTSFDRQYPDGRKIHLALVANPSHLEAVNPVVCGKVRAKQDATGPGQEDSVVGVLMHGDAAFAGQGVVYETMQLSQLRHYGTKGTIHVVVNNQIGFTTDTRDARSTTYCSDVGKCFEAPVFHVNADEPEAVVRVFELAAEWRQTFHSDVIIDLVGYRRFGHNELDQPKFTQPTMYSKIDSHPSVLEVYKQSLLSQGVCSQEEIDAVQKRVDDDLADSFERSKSYDAKNRQAEWLSSRWTGFFKPGVYSPIRNTGVSDETFDKVADTLVSLPEGFELHPSIKRIMKAKSQVLDKGEGIDWGTAEALAFGSLALEGNRVRLSGQDCERGTFSHRHAVLHDQGSNAEHMPLAHLSPDQGPVTVANSHLSEFAVMGFELGYSLESPHQLCLWEGQFGDFANGAQVIIDQFLVSGESKWHRQCGLVLLLPHGYDGQGPEHSSCRIERFLQACDDEEDHVPDLGRDTTKQVQHTNMQVVNATTPANYFHVLRRQLHRDFRKPLVIPSPKALLRHKDAVSARADFLGDTSFQRFLPEAEASMTAAPGDVRRVVLCSGKVYYDLLKRRRDLVKEGGEAGERAAAVAISRVEQVSPFPFDAVAAEAQRFPNAEVVWTQEEPRNMGAWSYVAPRIETALRHYGVAEGARPRYVGRQAESSPAAGALSVHNHEQAEIVRQSIEA